MPATSLKDVKVDLDSLSTLAMLGGRITIQTEDGKDSQTLRQAVINIMTGGSLPQGMELSGLQLPDAKTLKGRIFVAVCHQLESRALFQSRILPSDQLSDFEDWDGEFDSLVQIYEQAGLDTPELSTEDGDDTQIYTEWQKAILRPSNRPLKKSRSKKVVPQPTVHHISTVGDLVDFIMAH